MLALGFTLAACGEERAVPPAAPTEVVRPSSTDTLSFGLEVHALPAGLASDPTVSVATVAGVGTVVGGTAGLHELGSDGLVLVDSRPVTSLAVIDDVVVVGHADGVSVWSGALVDSPLTASLTSMDVRSLGSRDGELWIGTGARLHVLAGGELSAFEIGATDRIAAYDGGARIVLESGAGVSVLREDGAWSIQDLSSEIAIDAAVPSDGDRILAISRGLLLERVAVEGGAAWRPVALTTDPEDQGESEAQTLATDPLSGLSWVVTKSAVTRIAKSSVSSMPRPLEIGAPLSASVTTDGALWLSDGQTLARVGSATEPVTYANEIAAFSAANCERCHVPLGVGRPLDDYEAWKNEIDRIIAALDEGRMPQDGAALTGGSAELVKAWKADGLRP